MLSSKDPSHNCELLERAKAAYKSADYVLAESTFTTLLSRHFSSSTSADLESTEFVILLLDYRASCRHHLHLANTFVTKAGSSGGNRGRQKQLDWLALAISDAKHMIQLGPMMCRGYLRLAKLLMDNDDKLLNALDVIENGIANYSKRHCKLGRLLHDMKRRIQERIRENALVSGRGTLLTREIKQVLLGVPFRTLHLVDTDLTRTSMKHTRLRHLTSLTLDRCRLTDGFWGAVNKDLRFLCLKSTAPLPITFTRLNTLIIEGCEDQEGVDALVCANVATLQHLHSSLPYTHGKRLLSLCAPQSFNAFRLRVRDEANLVVRDPLLYALHLDRCTIRSIDAPNLLHLTLSSTPSLPSSLHPSLRSLHLTNVPITEGFLDAALRLPRLGRLAIHGCTLHIHTRHTLFTFLSKYLTRMDAFPIGDGGTRQGRFLFLISGFTNTADTAAFRSFYTNGYVKTCLSNGHEGTGAGMTRLKMEIGRRAEEVARRLERWYWQDAVP